MSTMKAPRDANYQLSESDLNAHQRMGLEPQSTEPDAILQNMMAFRNERFLHRRKCDFSGRDILSAYPENTVFPVYEKDVWWGDGWDPLEYGMEIDFSRPFFEQFAELQSKVPREGTSVFNSVNSDFNSHTRESKNCYMSSLVHACEDTLYSYWVVNDKDVVDCMLVNDSTLAYECIDCENLYNCVNLQDCINCNDCYFSYQLVGCKNCIACSNLSHKEYHILNKPVSKKEYESLLAELCAGNHASWDECEKMFSLMWKEANHRAVHNLKSENVMGDHLINCKNCYMCFDSTEAEDCAFSISVAGSKDVRHSYSAGWPRCELVYNCLVSRGSTDIAFCYYTFHSSGLRYCDSSMSSHDCFGSIGLKHKKHCILNKQYSEEEYQVLKSKLIEHMKNTGEWGRFFPMQMSTFPYNESAAQDYFPLTKQEILANNCQWYDRPAIDAKSETIAVPSEAISQLSESLTKQIFLCEETGKPFRIATPEFRFYKKMNLPLPRLSPEARFKRRFGRRNPLEINQRECSFSGEKIWSSFSCFRPEKICSEKAYLDSIE